jgi:dolichol-phosphate mannosyltransferase
MEAPTMNDADTDETIPFPTLNSMPELSVLIPAHNEGESIGKLVGDLILTLEAWIDAPEWEVIVADDGSTDATFETALRYADRYARVRVIRLDRNAGQSTALAMAVDEARGRWLATLDADGQNDPTDIPRLWSEALSSGCDAVLGWRADRQDDFKTRWISHLANWFRNAVLRQRIRDTGCSTRLVRASSIDALPRFEGWHRFLGPMIAARGGTIAQIPVNHFAREFGRSHYNLRNRGLRVVADLFGVAWMNRRVLKLSTVELATPDQSHRIDSAHRLFATPRTHEITPHFRLADARQTRDSAP